MSETSPRWADGERLLPNALERRQLFHILKRDSSHTAWERRLGYYRQWAEVAGESVRQAEAQGLLAKKPYPNSGVIYAEDKTNIDYVHHKRILDDLTRFEEGVARLGRGDKRVFTSSEHGLFLQAHMAADHWRVMYHRFFRSHENAWHEETPLREEFFAALHAYLNTGVESARYICESREQRELRHPAPMRYSLWAIVFLPDLPYPDPLPEVPEPAENRLVETGETVPYSGIWEPVEDGRIVGTMNYLHGGSPA
ncbi:MAG: immunity 71 family protein, partial [Zoogloeaceae bacterium]|nr:immunity 71 family protein [Zoogloeaceae bacterium]